MAEIAKMNKFVLGEGLGGCYQRAEKEGHGKKSHAGQGNYFDEKVRKARYFQGTHAKMTSQNSQHASGTSHGVFNGRLYEVSGSLQHSARILLLFWIKDSNLLYSVCVHF